MSEHEEFLNRAKDVKARHEQELMRQPGVVGVGIGLRQRRGQYHHDEVCIVITVRRKLAPADINPVELLPAELEGVPVDVQEVGDITAA